MKGDFVLKFLKGVINFGKDLHDIYTWERRYATPLYVPDRLIHGRKKGDKKFYAGLKNLEYREIIKRVDGGRYRFTKKGESWFRGSLLRYYRNMDVKWDKKWRVVIFDIPQELHNKRNRFRKKLKSLGFYKIQKSVFVFPYPCENELAKYCSWLDISEYINIIDADNLGYVDGEVKKVFNL